MLECGLAGGRCTCFANVDTGASLPDLRVSLVHDNPGCTDADAVRECVEANDIASLGAAIECGTGCAGQ